MYCYCKCAHKSDHSAIFHSIGEHTVIPALPSQAALWGVWLMAIPVPGLDILYYLYCLDFRYQDRSYYTYNRVADDIEAASPIPQTGALTICATATKNNQGVGRSPIL